LYSPACRSERCLRCSSYLRCTCCSLQITTRLRQPQWAKRRHSRKLRNVGPRRFKCRGASLPMRPGAANHDRRARRPLARLLLDCPCPERAALTDALLALRAALLRALRGTRAHRAPLRIDSAKLAFLQPHVLVFDREAVDA